ncbi:MAG TPA: T9SS type A sorting domain-containing protein [Candidatus Cloacimonadota bacterium]|nr:T9SS type A sorting domain-containing protein [Candidatus Cloacimonadota bacterium]
MFDSEYSQAYGSASLVTAPLINTAYSDISVPVIKFAGMHLLSAFGNQWQDLMDVYGLPEFDYDFPLIRADSNQDGIQELVGVKGSGLYLIDFAESYLNLVHIGFPEAIVSVPLAANHVIYINTASHLYKIRNSEVEDFISISGIKTMAMTDDLLLAIQESSLTVLNPESLAILDQIFLPEAFGLYEPVIYRTDNNANYIFLMADSGNIYLYSSAQMKKIFTNPKTIKPSQLAVFETPELAPLIVFGIDNLAYAMSSNGSMLSGFPYDLGGAKVHSGMHGKALRLDDTTIFYLPLQEQGYLAISTNAEVSIPNSLIYQYTGKQDFLDYDSFNDQLLWYYPTQGGVIHINSKSGLAENPILWQGFRNGGSGVVHGNIRIPVVQSNKLQAYVYPNPVFKGTFRLRMENANQPTRVSIYDISGMRIQQHKLESDTASIRELELDATRLSSGVYIISVESGKESKTLKFAVEK